MSVCVSRNGNGTGKGEGTRLVGWERGIIIPRWDGNGRETSREAQKKSIPGVHHTTAVSAVSCAICAAQKSRDTPTTAIIQILVHPERTKYTHIQVTDTL